MAHVELRTENGQPETVKLDRVPVKGDYIFHSGSFWLVNDVALTPGAMIEGVAMVEEKTNHNLAGFSG